MQQVTKSVDMCSRRKIPVCVNNVRLELGDSLALFRYLLLPR
jgi:hypothetical protein